MRTEFVTTLSNPHLTKFFSVYTPYGVEEEDSLPFSVYAHLRGMFPHVLRMDDFDFRRKPQAYEAFMDAYFQIYRQYLKEQKK